MMNGHYKIGLLLMGLLALAACQDNDNTVEDHSGENAVQFQTMVGQSESYSRAGLSTGYVALPAGYSLSVQMCSKDGETVSNVGNAATYTVGTTGTTDTPSALTSTNPLYWPSSTVSYGFTASAGLDVVMADQSLSGNLISSDKLSGYSATDASHDVIAYQTAKVWNNNTTAVPLYLKHDKAEITVILKAGTGVGHDAVKYVENNATLSDTIFSYGATPVAVSKPYTEGTTIDYSDTEKNVSTTKYTAIVDPYDYYTNTSSPITRIVLDNQKYSFYSTNDTRTDVTAKQSAYNLTAGKHLTLTITIGRDGRIINVDAQIKDWTLVANEDLSTDDFGHAGTPYTIDSYDKLNIFLSAADQNTKGKIAILAQDITLTDAQAAVISTKTLNCTLNLNGKTISTPLPLFTEVSESGVLKYGVINLTAANQSCVAAVTNRGIIEKVTTESLQGHVLTKAGLVETNTGIIKECSNNIIVTSSETAIGGIAATSTGTIDACLNNAKVYTANAGTIVGGIVGTASGTVTNNSYTYGITQSQATGTLGNIIGSATSVTASGNSWPTTAANAIAGTNAFSSPFDAVIDSETELKDILSGTSSNSYRVAASFTISDDTWKDNTYTLASLLDGNNKTITTKYRLFETITGTFKNATILLSASLASTTSTGGSDGMSAVAHILNGGTIDGLTAARSASETISASNPSGLVGVATAGATIANCINKVPLIISGQGTTVYAGGIVSEATKTTISGCRNASTATITLGTNHGTNTYVGGIVGVLNKDNKDTKDTTGACLVTDCTNFYDFTGCSATYIGGIVGLIGTKGSDSQCQGNWWPTGKSGAGASSESTGTIGKKNAIQPTE